MAQQNGDMETRFVNLLIYLSEYEGEDDFVTGSWLLGSVPLVLQLQPGPTDHDFSGWARNPELAELSPFKLSPSPACMRASGLGLAWDFRSPSPGFDILWYCGLMSWSCVMQHHHSGWSWWTQECTCTLSLLRSLCQDSGHHWWPYLSPSMTCPSSFPLLYPTAWLTKQALFINPRVKAH